MLEINKIASPFQFIGCSIEKMTIENHLLCFGSDSKVSVSMDAKETDFEYREDRGTYFGEVTLRIAVRVTTENDPVVDKFEFSLIGGFLGAGKAFSEKEFHEYLKINGVATLYSMARAKIEVISASSYIFGKIVIPMVNVKQYYAEVDKEAEAAKKSVDTQEQ